ncbi:hypothetical protein F383_17754 [Gossypium arboreum]|uniref:Uncharacterized protein n=1 Tax=Gossypium arboreum TaxID=29729 RepID=A0A0B0NJ02_GOSAR|nr:hypothetical protein F383_17754 [Gossypium arboreum]
MGQCRSKKQDFASLCL